MPTTETETEAQAYPISTPIELTEKQRRVVKRLPASGSHIATDLGVDPVIVRSRIQNIRERYDDDIIVHDPSDDRYHWNGPPIGDPYQHDHPQDPHPQPQPQPQPHHSQSKPKPKPQPPVRTDRVREHSTQALSRHANESLRQIEQETAQLLQDARDAADLAKTPDRPIGGVDLLIPRGDDHFGSHAESYDYTRGETVTIFDMEIAKERVRECTLEVARKLTALEHVYDFGTAHFCLLGDSVTGENIYKSQPHEIDGTIREQLKAAEEVYFEQIAVLADLFEHVHIPTVPGNHGEIRAKGSSQEANADDFLYDRLEAMVRVSDLDNVSFTRSWRTKFVNFSVRDWWVHARHGQDSLEHIGTTSGKNRWRGWLDEHEFDLALRQHYHEKKREPVRGRDVLMSGSISPPEDFEESLSIWSPPGAMLYLIGDGKKPIEASFDIYFD